MRRHHLVGAAAIALALGAGLSAQRGGAPAIPNLAGKILTVRGPIDPATNGPTLMHEHIFIDFKMPAKVGSWVQAPPELQATTGQTPTPPKGTRAQGPGPNGQVIVLRRGMSGWNLLDDYDGQLAEIKAFKKAGGGTIVDVTNFGLSRNP